MPCDCSSKEYQVCDVCTAAAEAERERAREAGQRVSELLKTQGGRDELRLLTHVAYKKIKHALAPKQWSRLEYEWDGECEARIYRDDRVEVLHDDPMEAVQRHAVAALCLYKQPFGFSRDDITALEFTCSHLRSWGQTGDMANLAKKLETIQNRLEALLPPLEDGRSI